MKVKWYQHLRPTNSTANYFFGWAFAHALYTQWPDKPHAHWIDWTVVGVMFVVLALARPVSK